MGRRARTNCSPVDSVLEKYHNDIGNRLSGVFMPPPTTESGQALSEEFSMLTLDTRRVNSVKNKAKGEHGVPSLLKNSPLMETAQEKSHPESCLPDTKQETAPNTAHHHHHHHPPPHHHLDTSDAVSGQENTNKDKTRLVDKLTRALFQKKHVCARCKRKSRTCVLNKTFNVTEKRYTCGRCRENSSALKNFFDGGQSGGGEKQADISSFSSLSSTSSPASKPRVGNDSGYETVTSCSTVASSYSAFNTPNNNNNNNSSKDAVAAGPASSRLPTSQQISTDWVEEQHCQRAGAAGHDHTQGCTCANSDAASGDLTSSALVNHSQYYNDKLPGLHDYDGYLPDFIEFRGWKRHMLLRPCSQGDAASASALVDSEDTADDCGGPDIICVRRPTSLDSSPNPARKACHTCGTTSVPCFRLPWEGGWLCEDCMDGIY